MNTDHSPKLDTIGIFNESFPPIMDGVALTIQNYAYWMHKKNQPVCVVTPRAPNYTDKETFPVYRYTSIPILGRKPYRLGLPFIDHSFQSTIQQIQFGIVHAHSPFSSGNAALRIARQQKVPFIATFHSKYRDDFENSLHCKLIAGLMVKQIVRFYEKADEVWISQPSVKETLREYGFKGKVEVVGIGNDFNSNKPIEPVKKQARKELNIQDNTMVFLFVGQLIWEKNIRLILESLELIKDIPFKMYFVGTGYAENEIKQLVHEKGLSSSIELTGCISNRDKLKQYYAAADLFLFPSNYDTWAIVIHEAAALQTPSILIESSTIAQSIIDNVNGFLIPNSPIALAARIRHLAANQHLIKEAGVLAANTINRSWESVTDEVLDRYHLLQKRTM